MAMMVPTPIPLEICLAELLITKSAKRGVLIRSSAKHKRIADFSMFIFFVEDKKKAPLWVTLFSGKLDYFKLQEPEGETAL